MTRIGFLGVGHLATYLVPALLRGDPPPALVLSPRGRHHAEALRAAHGLDIASDNAELVERCDVVLLATRPQQAIDAVSGLPWRADQWLISLCAGVPASDLSAAAGPARVARAMPVSSAAIGESPTAVFPDSDVARQVLAALGPVFPFDDEDAFTAACVGGAVHAWAFKLIAAISEWGEEAGLEPAVSRQLTSQILRGAAGMAMAESDRPLNEIIDGLATPGGISELGLDHLAQREAFDAWQEACQAVLERLRGAGR